MGTEDETSYGRRDEVRETGQSKGDEMGMGDCERDGRLDENGMEMGIGAVGRDGNGD